MGLFTNITTTSTGNTLCFQTDFLKKYLDFIENFNYQKYDIISINIDHYTWYVTYKSK